jgi:hypothetical protein
MSYVDPKEILQKVRIKNAAQKAAEWKTAETNGHHQEPPPVDSLDDYGLIEEQIPVQASRASKLRYTVGLTPARSRAANGFTADI